MDPSLPGWSVIGSRKWRLRWDIITRDWLWWYRSVTLLFAVLAACLSSGWKKKHCLESKFFLFCPSTKFEPINNNPPITWVYACCDGRHHGARSELGSSLSPLGTLARPPVQTCQRCATESPFYDQLFVEGIVKGTFNPNKLSQLRTKYCTMISNQRKLWLKNIYSSGF